MCPMQSQIITVGDTKKQRQREYTALLLE